MQEFARIGKSSLVQIVGTQINFKVIEYKEERDYSVCSQCEVFDLIVGLTKDQELRENKKITFQHTLAKLKDLNCSDCEKSIKRIPVVKYHNENNKYSIPHGSKRLSKLQIKQFLLYHFMPMNKKGVILNASLKEIASILDCTVKTVISNNKRLIDQHMICCSNALDGHINIIIRGYQNIHLTASEGGSGYLYLSFNTLEELLSITNVNSLRLEIRKLLKVDDLSIGKKESPTTSFSYSEIKRLLPDYVNYGKLIKEIASLGSSIFDTNIKNNTIEFTIKDKHNSKLLIQERKKEYRSIFEQILDEGSIVKEGYYKEYLSDLTQMAFQYGLDIVKDVLKEVIKNDMKKEKEISNFGAYIREITRTRIAYNYKFAS